jgi:hypothetical protein
MKVSHRHAGLAALGIAALLTAGFAAAAPAGASATSTARFWSGTDSNYIALGHSTPYREPAIGGSYGGYIGMIGNWANWQHCGDRVVWSKADSDAARTNLSRYHLGIGVGAYWFMAGPGVDPKYNGRLKEAAAWGQAQAAAALKDIKGHQPAITYPVVFLDVELPGDAPGYTPAPDNGWNAVYTSACSGRVRVSHLSSSLDRADFNGFADYLTAHSSYKAGVYSAPGIWAQIFGTGTNASIPNTYEWTYTGDSASLAHHPSGWCLSGTSTCAQFFGGVTAAKKYALMWQWSGGGGTYNGYGDFDQIDGSRTP